MFNIEYSRNAKEVAFLDASEMNLNLNNAEDKKELLSLIKFTLIETAKDAIEEELAKGFDKDHLTLVDGSPNKSILQVKPYGKIEYVARQDVKDIAVGVMKKLESITPVDTGLYKSLHRVFYNGEQIATNSSELESWFSTPRIFTNKDRIRFMNIAPYAQRLELQGVTSKRKKLKMGKTKDKKQRSGPKVRKPNGTYYLTYRQLSRKFRGNIKMRFEILPGNYVGVTEPIPPNSKQSFRADFHPNSKYNKGYYLYPTIVLTLDEKGLTNEF